MKHTLSPEESRIVELGARHVSEEARLAYRPAPMALLHEVEKLFSIYLRQNEEQSLRQSRRQLLFFLCRNDGCVQQDMVRDTHLSAPSVSVELAEMEKDGWITRVRDENDARATRIYITEAGKSAAEREREHFRTLSENALSGLSAKEGDALFASLLRIRKNLLHELKEIPE